jgi:hypothetical protein
MVVWTNPLQIVEGRGIPSGQQVFQTEEQHKLG